MSEHPFPHPGGYESLWSAKEHQAAANHYWYKIMGVDREDPNYRPYLSLLEAAFKRHTSKAKAMRSNEK